MVETVGTPTSQSTNTPVQGVSEQVAQAVPGDVVALQPPGTGLTTTVVPDIGQAYRIDAASASFAQQGGSLLVQTPQGNILLQDFFVLADTGLPPSLILPDGQELSADTIASNIDGFDAAAVAPAAGGGGGGGAGAGASFSAFELDSLGNGLGTLDLLGNLELVFTPPEPYYEPAGELEAAVDTTAGSLTVDATSDVPDDVEVPEGTNPSLIVTGSYAGGFEDGEANQHLGNHSVTPVALTFTFTPADNEVLDQVVIGNLPEGWSLMIGGVVIAADDPGAVGAARLFTVSGGDIGTVSLLPPTDPGAFGDGDADLSLSIDATISDPDTGETSTMSGSLPIAMDAVADLPDLTLQAVDEPWYFSELSGKGGLVYDPDVRYGIEDEGPVSAGLTASANDRDGSESLTNLTLSFTDLNVPVGEGTEVLVDGQTLTDGGTVLVRASVLGMGDVTLVADVTFNPDGSVSLDGFRTEGGDSDIRVLDLYLDGAGQYDESSDMGLQFVLPENSDDNFTVTVDVTSSEVDLSGSELTLANNQSTQTISFGVQVLAIADAPDILLPGEGAVQVVEDHAVALPLVIALTDTDGSESLSQVIISGIPEGSLLTWNGSSTLPDALSLSGGELTIDLASLSDADAATLLADLAAGDLSLQPPADSDTDFTLTVTAYSVETDSDGNDAVVEVASGTAYLDVTVDAETADGSVSVAPMEVSEGSAVVTPSISFTGGDPTDSNETNTLYVQVPAGWSVTDANGWTPVVGGDYDGWYMLDVTGSTGPVDGPELTADDQGSSLDAGLNVALVTHDPATDTDFIFTNNDGLATTTGTITVTPVIEPPNIDFGVEGLVQVVEDNWIDLNIDLSTNDVSETISQVTLSGFPTGTSVKFIDDDLGEVTLVAGTDFTGNLVLSEAEAESLLVKPAANSDVDFDIAMSVTVSETDDDGGAPFTQDFPTTIPVTVDAETFDGSVSMTTIMTIEDGVAVTPSIAFVLPDPTDSNESNTLYVEVPAGWSVTDVNGWTLVDDATSDYDGWYMMDVTGQAGPVDGPKIKADDGNSSIDASMNLALVTHDPATDTDFITTNNDGLATSSGAIQVDPTVDTPTVTFGTEGEVQVVEDHWVDLNIDLSTNDPSESVTRVEMTGFLDGTKIDINGTIFTVGSGTTVIMFDPALAEAMKILPPANSDTDFDLSMKVTVTDSGDEPSDTPVAKDFVYTIPVTVDAETFDGSVSVAPMSTTEGGADVTPSISFTVGDAGDGNEINTLYVQVPTGWSVADANGWTLVDDADSAYDGWYSKDVSAATSPVDGPVMSIDDADSSADATVNVALVTHDPATDTDFVFDNNDGLATNSGTITVTPTVDDPNISFGTDDAVQVVEDNWVDLNIDLSTNDTSETISSVALSDFPAGTSVKFIDDDLGEVTLVAGTDFVGTLTLSEAEAETLSLKPAPDSDVDFDLSMIVTVSDAGDDLADTPVTKDFPVTIPVTVDAETFDPTVSVNDMRGTEGGTVTPVISFTYGDPTDTNETNKLYLQVPTGYVVAALNGWVLVTDAESPYLGQYTLDVSAASSPVNGPSLETVDENSIQGGTVTVTMVTYDPATDTEISTDNNSGMDSDSGVIVMQPDAGQPIPESVTSLTTTDVTLGDAFLYTVGDVKDDGISGATLYRVDRTASGTQSLEQVTAITLSNGSVASDVEGSAASGFGMFYVFAHSGSIKELISIDLTTGTIVDRVAYTQSVEGAAFANGTLYALGTATQPTIYEVDTSTGVMTSVGVADVASSNGAVTGIAYSDGIFYLITAKGYLYTFDPDAPEGSDTVALGKIDGLLGSGDDASGLATDTDGSLLAIIRGQAVNNLYEINDDGDGTYSATAITITVDVSGQTGDGLETVELVTVGGTTDFDVAVQATFTDTTDGDEHESIYIRLPDGLPLTYPLTITWDGGATTDIAGPTTIEDGNVYGLPAGSYLFADVDGLLAGTGTETLSGTLSFTVDTALTGTYDFPVYAVAEDPGTPLADSSVTDIEVAGSDGLIVHALVGGDGADQIYGTAGDNLMFGGAGEDTFVFTAEDLSGGTPDQDTIADFQQGSDHIDIDALFAALGADAAATITTQADAGDGVANTLVTITDGGSTEFTIVVDDSALTANDFTDPSKITDNMG